jgi:hypothetical protein
MEIKFDDEAEERFFIGCVGAVCIVLLAIVVSVFYSILS